MLLYKGPYLVINYEKEHKRFVNSWVKSPSTKNEFKSEMLQYISFLKSNAFNQILWLQANFTFEMDSECQQWFDKNVHGVNAGESWLTRDKTGCHHLYFVVGENVLVQLEIMRMFKKQLKTKIKPRYFATQKEARECLNGAETARRGKQKPLKIKYKGTNKKGESVIEIRNDYSQFASSIQSLKSLLEDRDFIKSNLKAYSSLTPKEKEILVFIIDGFSNEEMAKKMELSKNTTRTHRNRIWKKLGISTVQEALNFRCFIT